MVAIIPDSVNHSHAARQQSRFFYDQFRHKFCGSKTGNVYNWRDWRKHAGNLPKSQKGELL
jgi:hypothetical protein